MWDYAQGYQVIIGQESGKVLEISATAPAAKTNLGVQIGDAAGKVLRSTAPITSSQRASMAASCTESSRWRGRLLCALISQDGSGAIPPPDPAGRAGGTHEIDLSSPFRRFLLSVQLIIRSRRSIPCELPVGGCLAQVTKSCAILPSLIKMPNPMMTGSCKMNSFCSRNWRQSGNSTCGEGIEIGVGTGLFASALGIR